MRYVCLSNENEAEESILDKGHTEKENMICLTLITL